MISYEDLPIFKINIKNCTRATEYYYVVLPVRAWAQYSTRAWGEKFLRPPPVAFFSKKIKNGQNRNVVVVGFSVPPL
jgi:hypothetical protein